MCSTHHHHHHHHHDLTVLGRWPPIVQAIAIPKTEAVSQGSNRQTCARLANVKGNLNRLIHDPTQGGRKLRLIVMQTII